MYFIHYAKKLENFTIFARENTMKRIYSYTKQTFRFRRWNRAGYSAFMSIGKQVSIGHLHTDVADGLLRDKHLSLNLLPAFLAKSEGDLDSESSSDDGDSLIQQQDALLTCLSLSQNTVLPASCILRNGNCLQPIFSSAEGIGFLFYNTMKRLGLFFGATLLSLSSYCQEDTLTVNVETVEIEKKMSSLASESFRIVTTLSKQEIAAMPVRTVSDLLDYLPGVDVRSRGTNGVQADMSVRGGTFDQVIVLLNGINITDPQTGHQNLDIPIDISIVDRIEVLQGTSMNVFGLSSFSGAINIVTCEKTDNNVEVGMSGGSDGYFSPHAGIRLTKDKWAISASISENRSEGYIQNTDYSFVNAFVHTRYHDSKIGDCNFQIGVQNKEFGANSFYSLKYPDQYEKDKTLLSAFQWEKQIKRLNVSSALFYRAHYDEFQLFRDMTDAPAWYTKHNYHISQVSGGNVKSAFFGKYGKTTVGVELRNEHIISNVLGDSLAENKKVPFTSESDSIFFIYGKNRLNLNYFGEQTFLFGKFSTSVGFSGNYNTMFQSNFCWGINMGYKFAQACRLYANVNNAVRLPTFTDMYYKSATQLANPDLRPEKSITTEVGAKGLTERFTYRISAYYRIGKDIIDWARTPSEEVWKSMNIDNVNAFGTELSVRYNPKKILKSVGATYAFCTLDKHSGTLVSKYALDYLHNSVTFDVNHKIYKHWGANWQLSYRERSGTYVGADGNTAQYEPFTLLDLQTYWENDFTKLFIEVSNLFGEKYFDYGGIEQPGMQLRAGITVQL